MIHDAKCTITVDSSLLRALQKPEPPIPTDAEIEEAFPGWRERCQIFAGRCLEAEGKHPTELTALDYFRYGMKFMIAEAKKLV